MNAIGLVCNVVGRIVHGDAPFLFDGNSVSLFDFHDRLIGVWICFLLVSFVVSNMIVSY